MQTLTLWTAVTAAPSDPRGELGGSAPPALHGLEAPLVPPFGEPAAWDQAHAPHPVVDGLHRGLAVEVEDDVGVRGVDLTGRDDPVRVREHADLDQRGSYPVHQIRLVEWLAAGVGDLAGDGAMSGWRVPGRELVWEVDPEEGDVVV